MDITQSSVQGIKGIIEKYFEEGRFNGRKEAKIQNLRQLMKNLNISLERAMELLDIPKENTEEYFMYLLAFKIRRWFKDE